MDSFFQQVYALVAQVPPGTVISYGQIARLLGRPRGARQVGWAMRRCPPELPWQRVTKADGTLPGDGSGVWHALLEAEGVTFLPDGRVDMAAHAWLGVTNSEWPE